MTRNLVIVHCHFEPGGVTQVVQNHVRALAGGSAEQPVSVFLAGSSRQSGLTDATRQLASVWTIDALDYDPIGSAETEIDSPGGSSADDFRPEHLSRRGQKLADTLIERMLTAKMDPSDTVVHWHNHSLGKNAAAPVAIARLADAGWPVLMQIHDFAEDQRPANYRHLLRQSRTTQPTEIDQWLYPEGSHLNFATLTCGDADALIRHGIPADAVAVLPNNVRLPDSEIVSREAAMQRLRRVWQLPDEFRWLLYPIRGIRRKNLGEFLLLCQCLQGDELEWLSSPIGPPFIGGITLRPDTPNERRSYERWRNVGQAFVPNVLFDVAHHPDVRFVDNLAAAHCIVSTSVAEGFGMTFLEPWLAGRPVVARRLPGVVADFEAQGVQLDHFYRTIDVPGEKDWLDEAQRRWSEACRNAWSSVPEPMRPSVSLDNDDQQRGPDKTIDFARLTADLQIDVIRWCHDDPGYRHALVQANESVFRSIVTPPSADVVQRNAEVIADAYSLSSQQKQLIQAYDQTRRRADAAVSGSTDPEQMTVATDSRPAMVDLIDAAHPFYPCRVEEPPAPASFKQGHS